MSSLKLISSAWHSVLCCPMIFFDVHITVRIFYLIYRVIAVSPMLHIFLLFARLFKTAFFLSRVLRITVVHARRMSVRELTPIRCHRIFIAVVHAR